MDDLEEVQSKVRARSNHGQHWRESPLTWPAANALTVWLDAMIM